MLSFLTDLSLPGYQPLLITGLLLGVGLSILIGRRRNLAPLVVLDGALAAAVGGLLVGRAIYTLAHRFYFLDHLGQAIAFWRGGLSAPGTLIGALLGILVLCRLRRIDPRPLFNVLAPGASVVVIAAWLGCLTAGCGYGLETWPQQNILWSLSAELPDTYGQLTPRVAVQMLGAVWNTVTGILALWASQKNRAFALWLFLHTGGEFGLSFLRGDYAPLVAGLSSAQIANLALAFLGLGLLIAGWRQTPDTEGEK